MFALKLQTSSAMQMSCAGVMATGSRPHVIQSTI
jgi:hypothetical protein